MSNPKLSVAIVGLGYVGLPVAVAFGKRGIPTIGFDINKQKIDELRRHHDVTEELTTEELQSAKSLVITNDPKQLKKANFIIIAVPTPVTQANKPDLSLIESASRLVGQNLAKGTTVVYESTVYPGVTEDICAPILAKESKLICGQDFFIGYSPERINPGDKEHTLEKITKVVAGQNKTVAKHVAQVYGLICDAGVYIAATIKTAEAAKVIENTQRDLNIALINELSLIFHRLGIDTDEVLEASATKWNFLNFKPGLVGGHCIGVDPYYLVHKAEEVGYHPQVIAAGRRVNDFMPEFVAQEVIKGLIECDKNIQKTKVLVLGLTFKEDVKDVRNSKIAGSIRTLQGFGITVEGYDPLLTAQEVRHEFPKLIRITDLKAKYDAIIIATPHAVFGALEETLPNLLNKSGVIMDVKKRFPTLGHNKNIIYKSL